MKNRNQLFCLILVIFAFTVSEAAAQAPERIGVVSFNVSKANQRDRAFEASVTNMLVSELVKNRRYEIIDRSQFDKVLAEIERCAMGLLTPDCTAELGEQLSLDYIIVGHIDNVSENTRESESKSRDNTIRRYVRTEVRASVNIQRIEVKTGRVAEATNGNSREYKQVERGKENIDVHSLYSEATRKAIVDAVSKFGIGDTMGRVAQVRGSQLTINIGSASGVAKKQRYEVIRTGDDIYDPATGALLAVEEFKIAEFTIEQVNPVTATGKINKRIKHEIVNEQGKKKKVQIEIQPGDFVQRIGTTKSFLEKYSGNLTR